MPSIPGLLYGKKVLIAHSTLLYVTISAATAQSCLLVREAAAEVATPGVHIESGKWIVINSSKVSLSDCVRSPDGATKELSLAFGSLDRALCNLANMGKSFMELQKALHES